MVRQSLHARSVAKAEENPREFFTTMFTEGVHRTERIDWLVSGVDLAFFNPVMRTDFPDDATRSIETVVAKIGAPMSWWVGPSTRPRKLGEQLVGCGFALYESLRVMSVSLARLRQPDYPEELVVRPVTNRRSLEEWLALWAEIWEIPASARPKLFEAFRRKGWTSDVVSYSGLLGGRLVALSTVFLGENAGVYNVATAPEARGKGVGSAMTHFALTEGRRRGLATGSLQSTKMGLHVYERLGFKELFKVDIYSLERR